MYAIRPIGPVLLALTFSLSLVGCDLFSGDSSGRIIVHLTDAPADVTAVTVSIVEIELIDTASGNRESVELDPAAEGINLLDYQSGAVLTIADATVGIDEFDQFRLVVGENPSITVDGVTSDVHIASGMSSGLKFFLQSPLEMDGDTFDITLDFDAQASIVPQGPPGSPTGYVLTPVIRPESATYNEVQVTVSEGQSDDPA